MKTYLMLVLLPALFVHAPGAGSNYSLSPDPFLKINNNSSCNNGSHFRPRATIIGLKGSLNYTLEDFAVVKANTDSSQVKITWVINDESDYCFYTVERSNDGGKTFKDINKTRGCRQRMYTIFDEHPASGKNIYRLKLEQDASDPIVYSCTKVVKYSN